MDVLLIDGALRRHDERRCSLCKDNMSFPLQPQELQQMRARSRKVMEANDIGDGISWWWCGKVKTFEQWQPVSWHDCCHCLFIFVMRTCLERSLMSDIWHWCICCGSFYAVKDDRPASSAPITACDHTILALDNLKGHSARFSCMGKSCKMSWTNVLDATQGLGWTSFCQCQWQCRWARIFSKSSLSQWALVTSHCSCCCNRCKQNQEQVVLSFQEQFWHLASMLRSEGKLEEMPVQNTK